MTMVLLITVGGGGGGGVGALNKVFYRETLPEGSTLNYSINQNN